MSRKETFGTDAVAKFIGVSSQTIRNWADRKLLPGFKLPSGQRRFRRDVLVSFMRSKSIELPTELKLTIESGSTIIQPVLPFVGDALETYCRDCKTLVEVDQRTVDTVKRLGSKPIIVCRDCGKDYKVC